MSIPEEYFKAGRIAAEVRSEIEKKVRVNDTLLQIAQTVESLVRSKGGEPAFPCNVCLNEVAAHYSPLSNDVTRVPEGALLKVDIGVHLDGYVADTAATISFNPVHDELVQATRSALESAVEAARKGLRVGEIGEAISSVAQRRGFKPISNLSGHMLDRYRVHAGLSIPNVWIPGTSALKANQVYAIEPFLTTADGSGHVIEGKIRNIFSFVSRRRTRDKNLDEQIDKIWDRFKTLPFSPRWVDDDDEEIVRMMEKLVALRVLKDYPVLIEGAGRYVAQAEHTIALSNSGVQVLT